MVIRNLARRLLRGWSIGNWRDGLDLVATLATIIVSTLVVWTIAAGRSSGPSEPPRRPSLSPPSNPVSLTGAQVQGDRAGAVAIIVFSDFLCPYCARFARETLPELKRVYVVTGKALLAFRHRPIEKLHPLALQASIAAHCAGLQGMFWEMHDWLFETQETLSERVLLEGATSGTALEQSKYRLCLSSGEADRAVRADMASAAALGVNATPVVFIGRVQPDGRVRVAAVIEGAKPIREFIRSIDAALMRLE